MLIDAKLLRILLRDMTQPQLDGAILDRIGDYLGDQCRLIQERKERIAQLQRELIAEEKDRALAIGAIKTHIAQERKECRHLLTTHQSDPAGDSSSTTCDLCGHRW